MNTDLKTFSTLRIGGRAHRVFEIRTDADILSAHEYALGNGKRLVIIGEGSNSVFSDAKDLFVIGSMKSTGIEASSHGDTTEVTAAGGESWDSLVAWAVEKNLSGIEALSWIPGTVGAAPIQNIGAYGSEVANTLLSVRAFDRTTEKFVTLSKDECLFSYRDSIFKRSPDRYVITHITLALSHRPATVPQYKAVQEYFDGKNPTLAEIREAIIEIRNKKLPDYRMLPNCGSFFKNPVVTHDILKSIQVTFPNIPFFETDTMAIKLYAGWLIENVDYMQAETDNVRFYDKNKLVLTNPGGATFAELQGVISSIQESVRQKFTVTLEVEPNIFT